ncbi:MAG: class I SAM-dependent methyltransferase [Actinomycetota bacterium]
MGPGSDLARGPEPQPAGPPCPLCRRRDVRQWKRGDLVAPAPEDLAITDRRYGTTLALWACPCGFRFADLAAVPDLTSLYGVLDDPAYEDGHETRLAQQRVLLERLRASAPAACTLLDVGAANGLLVEAATAAGIDAVGVEPSASLAEAARARGFDVRTGVLPRSDLLARRFDLVTCVDVVEHVADPVGLLEACRAQLTEDGRLLVVTPDAASLAARLLGRRWWHLRVAHVGYFTRRTLTDALGRAGLDAEIWWRPGWVFETGYLVQRVGSYVPPVARVADRWGDRRLLRASVPLNLFDSWGVIARCRR